MLEINPLRETDIQEIAAAFAALGWDKPARQYYEYLAEQNAGTRCVWVARQSGCFAGYVTLCPVSEYAPFFAAGIPEIKDLNVLPQYRRQGIAARLLDCAEAAARTWSQIIGIGVGLYTDYGAAQRIYIKRGYIPDGRGMQRDYQPCPPGATIINDDSLTLMLSKRFPTINNSLETVAG